MRGARRRGLGLLACCAAALAIGAASAGAKASPPNPAPGLQRALYKLVADPAGPPGISVLIDRGRRTEFLSAGFSDVAAGRTPDRDEHLRIASVSKGFNALVAVGGVNGSRPGTSSAHRRLEVMLGQRVPGLLPAAEAVTLRQLLQHTSGLPDYIRDKAFIDRFSADLTGYFAPAELTGFVKDDPLEFAPGSRYHYSDTDNIAAALIEEAATGRSHEELLASRVFDPLGMRKTSLPSAPRMPRPFMHGYDLAPGELPEDVSEALSPSGAWASGGIVSTPRDLGRFAAAYVPAILRVSKRLPGAFRPGSSSPPGPGKNAAGLGIFRYELGCGTVYGHTGSFPGYRLLVAASANGRRSVVFAANAQIVPGQGSAKIAEAITRAQARAICFALS